MQRSVAALTAITFLLLQLPLPPAEAAHLGSATASAGSAPPPSVSAVQSFQPDLFTGRATTAIPIAVPPGRKGVQPSLGVSYSSSGRNGWLGVGWSLDVGYIERSTKNGVPKYDSSDIFTFMFQGVSSDLVQIPDGTYRAKDEGLFLKFINNGVSGWEVLDKSGTRYLFGQTVASQIESTGKVFRWALDQVLDPHGNTLTVTYAKDQGQLYPSRIAYTGHEPTSLPPANQVDFLLEDRSDVETSYRSGFPVTTAKRLKAIETRATVDGALSLARRYDLTYIPSARTGRSLLASVTQIGTDGTTSLPATTFTYQSTGSATYPNVLSNIVPTPSVAGWNVRQAAQDTGHETWGCAHPYLGLPWGSPTQATGSFDLGCVSGSVSGSGDVSMSGCNDHFGHAWTYVYVAQAKTISLSHANHNDAVGCLYREDAGGVTQLDSGSISLPQGWSILHLTAYHQHQGWGPTTLSGDLKSQVEVMNPSQIPLGVPQLAGDVNGDATTDLIKSHPSNGSWSVSCATACTLPPPGTWLSGFGTSASTPLVGDWNGDGQTDVGIFSSGSWQFATSTGTRFQTGTVSGLSLGSGTPLTGDFNGDGITDIGTYTNGSWSVALGTGSGFNSAGAFSLSWGDSSYEALTGDFNGDGLTDIGIVNKSSGAIDVRLSTGSGWTSATNWIGSFGGANPHTSADFNGDGLTDSVYYNRSAGQVIYAPSTGSSFSTPVTLPLTFSLTSSDDNIQVGDFNGDSIADPAVFNLLSGSSQLALSSLTNTDGSNGTATDVLRTITNGLGGTATLTYQPSTLCGCGQDPLLPFIVHVVQKAKQEDGLGNSYTTTYLFHGGLYDAPTKEFRGFEEATVFDADGNKAITHFHQDTHKKGRPFRTEFRDQHDTLWTKTEPTWSCTDPSPGVHFVHLDQTDSFTYDGDASFKQVRSRFTYDLSSTPFTGNLLRTDEDGDVTVSGDERSTVTTYVRNPTAWILNTPSLTQTLDAQGTVVAQRRFFYDGATAPTTPPTTGSLTTEEEWLNLPTEQWLATTLTYDPTGNVKTVTDALGRTTTNTYDPDTHTSLTEITNTLGHTRQLLYEPRTGQVTASTDQNGQTTTTEYDALGRVVQVIGPTDSATLPTLSYAYDLSTNPAKTTVTTRIQSGQSEVLTVYAFTDGLGRTIQTRSPAEDATQQVVTGTVEFDARGLVVKQWVPYLSTMSSSYVPFTLEPSPSTLAAVSYSYDPLGRLLTITDPDGSVTRTRYDDWSVTVTDANGHQTRRTADASGRLSTVEELNGAETSTTRYHYDTLNHLLQVTDAKGNLTTITYDSLGRKLSMDDPDMGHWTYAYDTVDNLVSQTDARGVTISFTYDPLNRLTQKSYTDTPLTFHLSPVTYAYDAPLQPFSKGKLTEIADGSGSSSFEYDSLGRLMTEEKVIDGSRFTVHRAYDLLGRLTSLTYPDGDVVSYTYNPQGGLETITLQAPSSTPQAIVTDVTYNAAGQLTKLAYGNGTVSDYTYDPQTLRLSSLTTRTSHLAPLQDFSYTFDPVGNVTAITDRVHTGTQAFQYDPLNRLTQAQGAYGTFNYSYDPLGNMTEKEGVAMTYGEGAAGPHAVTSVHSPQSIVHSLSYDANGNLVEKTIDYGLSTIDLAAQRLTYDAENRLTEVTTAQEATVTLRVEPGWNFFSLPVIPEDAHITALFPNFSQDFEQLAWFDAKPETPDDQRFQRFVNHPKFNDFDTLQYGQGYQLYCTNPAGVTLAFKGKLPTKQASTNLLPGWHLLPAITTEESKPLSWLLSGVSADQVARYSPTTQQLEVATEVTPGQAYFVNVTATSLHTPPLPKDVTTRFVYDGDGGRVKSITPAGTTTYLGELVEKAPTGTTTKYLFAGSLRIAAKDSTGETRFYHPDHLGSSNVVTDQTGKVVELAEHTPYGALSRREGSANVAHKFTGQRQDSSNGLVLFPARAYDPTLGRFLQPDPFVQDPSDPQTLNRYAYVRNNPVNLVDPSGHFFQFLIAVVIAALKAAAIGAAVGAAVNATVAAVRGEDIGTAALRGAAVGAVSGGILGAGGFLIGAQGLALAGTAKMLAEIGLAAASGAIGGGVDSRMQGGSFSQGLLSGAAGGVLGYGISQGLGAAFRVPTEPSSPTQIGNQVTLSQQTRQLLNKAGLGSQGAEGAVAISEDTVPAGYRLVVQRGAINAPTTFTKPGETFIRVGAHPKNLKFSFRKPGGILPETYAFPEDKFLKFGNNPYAIKYFGDLPGPPPTVYGRFTPPAGTPIRRGIVPGGQHGGVGGVEEAYFPEGF